MQLSNRLLVWIFLILGISCNDRNREILVYANTENPEISSDFDYHLGNLKKYLNKHSINYSNYKELNILEEQVPLNIKKEIKSKNTENFLMVLIDGTGKFKILKSFGTDVDMIREVNNFYGLN